MRNLQFMILSVITVWCISGCDPLITIQPTPAKGFIKFYGGVENQMGTDMQATPDGGFILLGSSRSFSADGNADLFMVKTDSAGNAEWTLLMGGPNPDRGRAVRLTPSVGGYAVIGDYGTNATGDSTKIYFAKVTAGGQLASEFIINSTTPEVAYASTFELLPDGSGYILMGTTTAVDTTKNGWNPATDLKDMYVARIRPLEAPTLEFEQQHGFAGIDEGVAVRPFANGTYDILGNTTIPNENHTDIIFSKISVNGLPLISTKVIGGPGYDHANSMTPDGTGYLIAGSDSIAGTKRFFWTRTDDQGNPTLELRRIVGPQAELSNVIALDQGFVIAGTTLTSARAGRDFYLAQTTLNGEVVWESTLGSQEDDDIMGKVMKAPGGYIFVGTSGFRNNSNLSLTKINLLGEL